MVRMLNEMRAGRKLAVRLATAKVGPEWIVTKV